MFHDAKDRLSDLADRSADLARERPWLVAGAGVSALVGGYLLSRPKGDYRKKKGTGGLSGGGIDREKVESVYSDYYDSYGKEPGSGITDRSRTTGDRSSIWHFQCFRRFPSACSNSSLEF